MRYRIIEEPKVGEDPLFFIQAWGHEVNTSIWSNKIKECWCSVTETGYPIDKGYDLRCFDSYLGSFKSIEAAKEYLDKIIEYRKKEVKTVFEIDT